MGSLEGEIQLMKESLLVDFTEPLYTRQITKKKKICRSLLMVVFSRECRNTKSRTERKRNPISKRGKMIERFISLAPRFKDRIPFS